MAQAQRKLATYADLLAYPEDVHAEVLRGELAMTPSPTMAHGNTQRAVGRFVGGPFHDDDGRGGPGGWFIIPEVDVALGPHDIVRPDVTGWRRARLPSDRRARPIDVVPDWICEIASPSTASRDRIVKRNLYAEAGVAFYWMIDPELRTLEAFALRDGAWVLVGAHTDEDTARIAPFDAIELEVGRLFMPREPDAP